MKKAFVSLVMCLCPFFVVAQKSQTALVAEVSAGEEADEWVVSIALSNKEDIVALQVDVELPDDVSAVEVEKTKRTEGLRLTSNRMKNGMLRIIAYSPSSAPIKGNSGEILLLGVKTPQWQSDSALHLRNIHLTITGNKDMKLPDTEYSL